MLNIVDQNGHIICLNSGKMNAKQTIPRTMGEKILNVGDFIMSVHF